MRWLIVTDDFPPCPGGVATWTAAVAGGLAAAGHEVTVLARHRPGLAAGPWTVIGVRGPSFGRHGAWWTALAALPQRPDRVLATTWTVAARLTGRLARRGIPLHVTFHGSDLTRPPRDPAGFVRVCQAATRWTASAWLCQVLAERGFTSAVLPPPVDPGPATSAPDTPTRWVYAGRATPLKGGDRFVRLVAAAGARGTVFGDGPALPSWKALADRLGADVEFTGHLRREALRAALSAHHLAFLLPRPDTDGTGAEGFGLTLVEAAAAGLATVGCRTGGVPEAVGAGLILDHPDDIDESVAAIRQWWTPRRGAECQAWVRRRCGVAATVAALTRPSIA